MFRRTLSNVESYLGIIRRLITDTMLRSYGPRNEEKNIYLQVAEVDVAVAETEVSVVNSDHEHV